MNVSSIKELRYKTNVGIADCKKALEETNGDVNGAIIVLKKRGLTGATTRSGEITSEGLVHSYIHNGKYATIVEVNCETDFVARTEDFKALVNDIAMHITAANPISVDEHDLPDGYVENEKVFLLEKATEEGKKESLVERIVEGQIEKHLSQVCLLKQAFVKDMEITVGDLIAKAIAQTGENIVIRRFIRYELGEGLKKKQENLAEEVSKLVGKGEG